ncbi:MAG: aminopeptidase P N-terminal domain-containing protein, partial [bacterium]
MFAKEVYIDRRNRLKREMGSGIALFMGNVEAAYNYPANTYHFRQDSHFLYFFGLDHPGFAGVIDFDNDTDYLFGNDFDIEDIIWMGVQPKVTDLAAEVGISKTGTLKELEKFMVEARKNGQTIHFLPPYRGATLIQMADLLHLSVDEVRSGSSEALIKAVVKLKEIKDQHEIAEIERAVDIAYLMHTTSMKMAQPGVREQEIVVVFEGISMALGGPV